MHALSVRSRVAAGLVAAMLALWPARPARGEIVSTSFDTSVGSVDLTKLGKTDWAVFGRGRGLTGATSWEATDFRKGGIGIARRMKAAGLTGAFGGDGVEDTDFTKVAWSWDDGTRRQSVAHTTGGRSGTGMRVQIDKGGYVAFEFAGPGRGRKARACLLLRRDGVLQIAAEQAGREKVIDTSAANGLASVVYDGVEPLTILIRPGPKGKTGTARGFALTLGEVGRDEARPARVPKARSPRDRLLERLKGKGEPDYLRIVKAYAECMIRHGRDRYGKVHSPLFASTPCRHPPAVPRRCVIAGPWPFSGAPRPARWGAGATTPRPACASG